MTSAAIPVVDCVRPASARAAVRKGTLLIVMAGLSALMTMMALAFLARMRSDGEESQALIREAQARLVLNAALMYIQEGSRLGWSATINSTTQAREAFGWIDIRDGSVGPRDITGTRMLVAPGGSQQSLNDPTQYTFSDGKALPTGAMYPVPGGRPARCPMHAMRRPPYAIRPTFSANPMTITTTSTSWKDIVHFHNPDPLPAIDIDDGSAGTLATGVADFIAGDPTPRAESTGLAWFRVYRMAMKDCKELRTMRGDLHKIAWNPGLFLITCGAGGSRGFRDWKDVQDANQTAVFADDAGLFEQLQAAEVRQFFMVEWCPDSSANVGEYYTTTAGDKDMAEEQIGDVQTIVYWYRSRNFSFGGAFRWIQRIDAEPIDASGKPYW